MELLEAQAATGNMADPVTGRQMSVNRAISVGLVDGRFASALRRAELAVLGYQSEKNHTLSLDQAMKRGLVIETQGVRLLDAQISTGGLIDPVGGYRIPLSIAVKNGLLDQKFADTLANPAPDQKGFYDPNTGKYLISLSRVRSRNCDHFLADENLTYSELLRRTVVDKKRHLGMRLLPLSEKGPNVRVISKVPTKARKIQSARSSQTNIQ